MSMTSFHCQENPGATPTSSDAPQNVINPPSAFLQTLREIVDSNSPSLVWGVAGVSFKVATSFSVVDTLPLFAGIDSFTSFLRQLHMHGFRKIAGADKWEFSHDSFVAEKPELMSAISIRRRNMAAAAPADPAAGPIQGRVRAFEDRLASIEAQMECVLGGIGGARSLGKRKDR